MSFIPNDIGDDGFRKILGKIVFSFPPSPSPLVTEGWERKEKKKVERKGWKKKEMENDF